jgi:hypothetical protein
MELKFLIYDLNFILTCVNTVRKLQKNSSCEWTITVCDSVPVSDVLLLAAQLPVQAAEAAEELGQLGLQHLHRLIQILCIKNLI